ncbi:cyclic pyranopterin monophosphate synthase, mitochondrial-like [Vicia villosa]|uniref:cyclic pyranopterin monophosphate synthase, mitochondrial-like n=1 Tax=Vicia villosa TaxID=3911 RepID=UPI00273AFE7A|nr:cyclic pyranopterin monophosphate synthase, mitochondrial-like [Vicia villosa]XP_058774941.1 cyclic pyranopterin monophosphate synthase, mitochondrial-like [Vicia villosa]
MFLRRIGAAFPLSKRFLSSSVIHDYASSIQELNKEMESVFGELPPDELPTSVSNSPASSEPHVPSRSIGETKSSFELTHTGNSGEAQMVDVSPKESSKRTATAVCKVVLGKKVFDLVSANQMAKGDVLTVAKIAGITAAKQTSNLIPLCHNIGLSHVQVDLRLNHEDFSVTIEGEAASMGKTGVEMEAMTAVSIAGLTVYDMCKAASKGITITDIRLKHKSGGKSGDYSWGQ